MRVRCVALIAFFIAHLGDMGLAHSEGATIPTLAGIALPTRRTPLLALRARAVASALRHFDKRFRLVPEQPVVDLSQQLSRAERLFAQARFDQAASMLDAALDQAAPVPHRLTDPAALITAIIRRVSIAIARGETARAEELIARMLHYDPTSSLLPAEDDPRTHAAIEVVRSKLGPSPPLGPEVLAATCRIADVVIIARAAEDQRVEFMRYDQCHLVAQFRALSATGDAQVAARLVVRPTEAPQPTTVAAKSATATQPSLFSRPIVVAGVATAAVGVAALTAGGVFFVLAKSSSDELNRTPQNATYDARLDHELHRRETLATVSAALGAAAAITGTALLVFGIRNSHRSASFAVTATRHSIGVTGAF